MNILVVAHYQGDGSPCAIFIHEQVKEYVKTENNVFVLVPISIWKKRTDVRGKIQHKDESIDGVKYVYMRYFSLSKWGEEFLNSIFASFILRLFFLKKIKSFNPDIIHAHTFGLDSDIGIYLKSILKKSRLVVTTHGSDFDIPFRNGRTSKITWTIKKIDYLVTVSEKLKNNINDIYANSKTTTILNGCKMGTYKSVNKMSGRILFVGNLIRQKNADIVIRAFSELKKKGKVHNLIIVGDGPEYGNLLKLCDELGITDSVAFMGRISNDEVLYQMSLAEYFVMPSINEGFGIVYIEAMSCGCITIGTYGEGVDGFIRNGVNGYLVNPSVGEVVSTIMHCEQCDEEKKRITELAKRDAKKLTWFNNANNYLQLFERLLIN